MSKVVFLVGHTYATVGGKLVDIIGMREEPSTGRVYVQGDDAADVYDKGVLIHRRAYTGWRHANGSYAGQLAGSSYCPDHPMTLVKPVMVDC